MTDFQSVIEAFVAAAAARDIDASAANANGKLNKCGLLSNPRKKCGRYILHLDGRPAGGFENHSDGLGWQDWKYDGKVLIDSASLAEHNRKLAARITDRERERQVKATAAAATARTMFESAATDCGAHPYLVRKGVGAYGVRRSGDRLLVPMRNADKEICGLQTILPAKPENGGPDKLYSAGVAKTGLYHSIGKPHADNIICVAEGYATAATVFEATQYPTIVAFDAANLEPVVGLIAAKYPTARIVVCCDDDFKQKLNNTGRVKGEAAAGKHGAVACYPIWPDGFVGRGSDFNDLSATVGIGAVREQVVACAAGRTVTKVVAAPPPIPATPSEYDAPWCPAPYRLEDNGCIVKPTAERDLLISPVPLWICGVRADAIDRTEYLVCRWQQHRLNAPPIMHQRTVERAVLLNARNIVGLAAIGFPVDTNCAAAVVEYLRASETVYKATTERADAETIAAVTGWHGADDWTASAFLVGVDRFGLNCPTFEHADANLANYVRRFGTSGNAAEQIATLQSVVEHSPDLATVIATALASPLVRLVGAPVFVLDLAAATSQGKTKALRVAASIFGSPDNLLSWDSTRTGLETHVDATRGLPVCIDESQRAKNDATVTQTIYDLTTANGRTRGAAAGGIRKTARFESLVISTGEQPLADFGDAGGARARVLTIGGPPWSTGPAVNRVSDAVAAFQRRTLDSLADNYGHAGRMFAAGLVGMTEDDRRELRARFRQLVNEWSIAADRLSSGHPVGSRLAEYAATVALAGEVAERFVGIRPPLGWLLEARFSDMLSRTRTADVATTALDRLVSWCLQRAAALDGHPECERNAREYIGIWSGKVGAAHPRLSIVATAGADMLKGAGYQVGAVVSQWSERGWLVGAAAGTKTTVCRLAGGSVRCWKLSDAALARFLWSEEPAAVAAATVAATAPPLPDDDDDALW